MWKYFALLALIILPLSASGHVRAQTVESHYFSETGHNVFGDFLAFYQSNPAAEYIFGYPITEQIPGRDGRTVQYFQRARFELNADQPEGQRVTLTALGRETYVSRGGIGVGNSFSCRFFAETGFSVCFAFLDFYEDNGGAAQFGFPISNFENHDSKIVQYFERARLEWQPWRPDGFRVVISDLGRTYFDQLGEDPALLRPASPINNAPRVITGLHVRAFVLKAVTLSSDNQTFFVIVQDQNLQPIANAACTAVVKWHNSASDSRSLYSDEYGIGNFSLQFNDQEKGSLVPVEITCAHEALTGTTITSFRIWY